MKKLVLVCCMFLCLIPYTITNASSTRELEEGEVYINYTNFPDEHFREYLRDNFDTDGDGIIQTKGIKVLNISNYENLESIDGIEFFTDLEELDCSNTLIKEIDLSKNNKIKKLNCSEIWLTDFGYTSLNLSGATKLEYLNTSYTDISNFDISDCIKLKTLICDRSLGVAPDLSNNVNLEVLKFGYEDFTEIDISKNTKLKELVLNSSDIEYIDFSNNINLEKCEVIVERADFSYCNKLTELSVVCDEELILPKSNLETLEIHCYSDNGNVESDALELDFSDYSKLKYLKLWNLQGGELDLNNCIELEELILYSEYKTVILPNNNSITNIESTSRILEEINLSECGQLRTISICGNNVVLDLSNSISLESIYVDYDNIKKLIIPDTDTLNCLTLSEGRASGKIDLSKLEGLDYLSITDEGWNNDTKIISFEPWKYVDEWWGLPQPYVVANNQIENFKYEFTTYDINYSVTYSTHVQTYGWQATVKDGEVSGTTGESKRLEGIIINLDGYYVDDLVYTTHVQSYGWLPWCRDGEFSGTEGESKRMEAIMIKGTSNVDVYYRVHAQNYGWLNWAKNGEPAGTAGYGKRLEGIQIVVVKKGEDFDRNMQGIISDNEDAYIAKNGVSPVVGYPDTSAINPAVPDTANVSYRTHIQNYGWQGWKYNGQSSGTSGESKRLEGIKIRLTNNYLGGSVLYTTHVQNYGWLGDEYNPSTWSKDGEFSGTEGESKRLEAIRIMLSGKVTMNYDIYYRVHAQTFGWLGWAKNGEPAGTAGYSKRLEAIEIMLVKKGDTPPTSDVSPFIEK